MAEENGYVVKIGVPEMYASLQRVAEGNQRLEAKLDSALSIQTLRLEMMAKELARLQAELEEAQKKLDEIDRRPVVTPKAMLTGLTVTGVLVAIITSVVGLFVK